MIYIYIYNSIVCCIILCDIVLCYTLYYYIVWSDIMLCHTIFYHIILYCVRVCYVVLCYSLGVAWPRWMSVCASASVCVATSIYWSVCLSVCLFISVCLEIYVYGYTCCTQSRSRLATNRFHYCKWLIWKGRVRIIPENRGWRKPYYTMLWYDIIWYNMIHDYIYIYICMHIWKKHMYMYTRIYLPYTMYVYRETYIHIL